MFYITTENPVCQDGFYEFRRTISSPKVQKINIRLHTVGKYILYVNDEYVCEGPCRGPGLIRYFDEVSVGFKKGDNRIVVLVLQLHAPRMFSSMFKNFSPQLLMDGKGEGVAFESDLEWECYLRTNHIPFKDESFPSVAFVPPMEEYTTDLEYKKIPLRLDNDGDFDKVDPQIYGCNNSGYFLNKRPIPMLYPEAPFDFKVVKKGKDFVELDAGKYTTAKLEFVFNRCDNIRIQISEAYAFRGENKKNPGLDWVYYDRTDTSGTLNGVAHIVHATHNFSEFKTFWFHGLRYIRIEAENIDRVFVSAKGRTVHYPLDEIATFECSDSELEQMFRISINTVFCSTHEIFVDCPYYEQQQYQMDTAIEASCWMRMGEDVRIVKKAIDDLASSQQQNGLLCANYPCDYIQIIPGFSFFWIFMLREYMDYYNDTVYAKNYLGVIDKIFNYFETHLNENGLITTSDFWDYVDWVHVWHSKHPGHPNNEDGEAITTYNLYYINALQSAAYIFKACGNGGRANEYLARIDKIKTALVEFCYDDERALFRDGNKNREFGTHNIIWSILGNVGVGDSLDELFASDVAKASFSMNYYLFRALEKCGRFDTSVKVLDGWREMIHQNCTTWPEIPENYSRSQCHGWSSAPLYEISANILGVKVDMDDCVRVEPKRFGLDYARGTVPTRYGWIGVDIDYLKGILKVTGLPGVEKRIKLENGNTVVSKDEEIYIEI